MAREVASLTARFTADTSNLVAGIDRAGGRLARFASNTRDTLDRVGGQFMRMGALGGALFAPAIAGAMQFETSMANAQAILGVSDEAMSSINDRVLEMGTNSLPGAQQAATAFFDIVSGVSDQAAHFDILAASIALAEAGQADLTTTTSGLIAVMNAYGLEGEDATRISDLFTMTVQTGVGSMDQFVSAMSPVAGMMSAAGISVEEFAADMSLLTQEGAQVGQAATRLQAAATAFLKPNAEMQAAIEGLGFESGAAMLEVAGLQGSIHALHTETGGLEGSFAAALGSTEALAAGLVLANSDARDFKFEFIGAMEGATEAARAIQLDTAAAQFTLLKNQVTGLAITVGMALLPGLQGVFDTLQPIVQSIADWVSTNPQLVTGVAGLAAGMVALGVALKGAAIAFGLLTSPITAGIALGIALWVAWNENFLGIRDTVEMLGEAVVRVFGMITDTIGNLIEIFQTEGLVGVGQAILTGILAGMGNLLSWSFTNIAIPIITGLIESVPFIITGVMGVGGAIFEGILAGLGSIGEWVMTNIINPFLEALAALPGMIAQMINNAIPNEVGLDIPSVSVPVLGEIFPGARIAVDLPDNPISFARGTPFTGNGAGGFMAQLHPREAVVPAGGMVVHPSRRGLMLDGAGGMVVNIENLQARDLNDLLRQLQQIAKSEGF